VRTNYIAKKAAQLMRRYGTNDPATLCYEMHILYLQEPMGCYDDACKGFFMVQSRQACVVVNCDMNASLQRCIAAHELGHAVLHRGSGNVVDFAVFDIASQMEYEANLFAAELLLPDERVCAALGDGRGLYEAAAILMVPPQLLNIKLRSLYQRGRLQTAPPLAESGDFWGKLPCA